jgi:hypothetical protein
MGWEQTDQPKTGQTGTTLESPVAKPSSNESVHSIFISDFLNESTVTKPDASKQKADDPKRTVEAEKVAPAPKPPAANPLFQETNKPFQSTMEAPNFAQPLQIPPTSDIRRVDNQVPAPKPPELFYGMQPQGPPVGPGRDMTYRSMVQQMAQAQQGETGQGVPAEGGRRRLFQPSKPGEAIQRLFGGRRPEAPPPGMPQEQPRQRLFGRPEKPDTKPTVADVKNMQKIAFNDPNETGIVKEMALPAQFKEVPKDPNLALGEDPIKHEYANGNSRVALYEGRGLSADEQKSLKGVLAKQGKLVEGTPQFDDACQLMGAGYFNFFNKPEVAVGKFQGKDVLILSDEDPQTKVVGQTIIIPSDKGQFLYAISFQGAKADFPAVQKGLSAVKFRPTPDVVTPPAPVPRKK